MQIRKLFKAETAHEVPGAYTTRCHHLHGHSYRFELVLKSNLPNDAQMVADFKGVKDAGINDFFDSFDHAVLLWDKDPLSKLVNQINPTRHIIVPFIPTAEMMAKGFFTVCQLILETHPLTLGEENVNVESVTVHETETGSATYSRADIEDDRFPDSQLSQWIFSDGIKSEWIRKDWLTKVLRRLEQPAKH